LKNIVNSQLNNRQFNVQQIKEKADREIKKTNDNIMKELQEIKKSNYKNST